MKCRSGHDSTTTDYCSECGLEMAGVPGAFDADATPLPSQLCPVCTTDRDDPTSPFCGVCGFNFVTKVGGDVVAAPAAPAPAPKPRSISKPAAAVAAHRPVATPVTAATPRIEIEVTYDTANPEAPKGQPVRKFSLYDDENLLGRRSSGIAQTIGLDGDDFISRRHLLIIRQAAGYVVRLFDNTNGGTHDGAELLPGVEVPLAVGSTVKIGSYTLIRVVTIR